MIRANALALPIADECVQCVVTSPPYFGLRDYGVAGQIGLEPSPSAYVSTLVAVFRQVRRVLKADGVAWLNLGDSYAGSWGAQSHRSTAATLSRNQIDNHPKRASHTGKIHEAGVKPKDLYGIPWRVAFALQADGWYLRSDVVWSKPNPMPESVTDRPTKSHEYVFLLTKSERYSYDADAIREPFAASTLREAETGYLGTARKEYAAAGVQDPSDTKRRIVESLRRRQGMVSGGEVRAGANARTVWSIATQPFPGAHFATMPEKLVERCVLTGSRTGDLVFDPFLGSGTVARVARRYGRRGHGCDLNRDYLALAQGRAYVPQMSLGLEMPA